MIGPSPNPLILSYLKYAISSQVNDTPFPTPSAFWSYIIWVECGCQLVLGT